MNKEKTLSILNKTIEWSLYILILSIPFSKSIVEICITIAFFAWISKKILTKDFRLKKTPLNNLLFAFFIVTLISFVNAEFKLLFMRSIITKCLKYIILYFIVVESMDSVIKLKNLLTIAAISAIVVMIDAYIQCFIVHYDLFRLSPAFKYIPVPTTDPIHRGFPTGPFSFPNDLSAWMLIILIPALSLFIWGTETRHAKFIFASVLTPFLFLFYLANTRSAWLSFFISFFSILFFKSRKIFLGSIIALLLLAALMLLFSSEIQINRIFGFTSVQDRLYMWGIGWKIFTEHPIIGNGLNMFFLKFKELREDSFKGIRGSYAHNGYLQMAAEIGVIGLAVFLLLIGKMLSCAFRYIRNCKNSSHQAFTLGLAGGLSAFLIHSFFDTNLQSLPLVIFFWFSVALLMNLKDIYARRI